MQRKTSEVLTSWKSSKTVTIEVKDEGFERVIEEFQRQTDVRFKGEGINEKIKLSLRDAPFWDAVTKLSVASRASFATQNALRFGGVGENSEIVFDPSVPPSDHYQLIGPFHIGVWCAGNKKDPHILIRVSALSAEANPAVSRGIRSVMLATPNGKKITLKPRSAQEELQPEKSYWVIPPELLNRQATLQGEIECEVYSNPHVITVPVQEQRELDFKHFGGGKVGVTISSEKLEYMIGWSSGLNRDDAKKLSEFKNRRGDLNREEEEAMWDWIISKNKQLRLLHLQALDLVDMDDKVIPLLSTNLDTTLSPELRGTVTYAKEHQPKELRLRLSERKLAVAVFEFKNILPHAWK